MTFLDSPVSPDDNPLQSILVEDSAEVSREQLARQAAMILSAMDAAGEGRQVSGPPADRRDTRSVRVRHRTPADLHLFADPVDAKPWALFLRDIEPRAAGFICPDRLPLGYGGRLSFTGLEGQPLTLDVTLVRCRVCYGGWYEGALYFHHNQPQFALPDIEAPQIP